jgi:hypothetical protein
LAEFCRARKEFCFRTETVPQAAVLHLASHYYATNPHLFHIETGIPEIEGALHVLLETQRPTDLLFEDGVLDAARLAGHKLVVAPEQTRLQPDIIAALEKFASAGGQVILSGAHLSRECPDFVGAEPVGETLPELKLPVGKECAVAVGGPWQVVKPRKGTKALGYRLSGWEPVEHVTGDVVVTQRKIGAGSIVAIHGPVFRDYYHGHYPQLREFLRLLVQSLKIDWLVQVKAPPQIEVVARQKDGRLLVNLVNRGAAETLSHTHVMTEDINPVRNVVLRIKRATPPARVT